MITIDQSLNLITVTEASLRAQAFVRETGHSHVLRGGQINAVTSRSAKGSAVSSTGNYSLALLYRDVNASKRPAAILTVRAEESPCRQAS